MFTTFNTMMLSLFYSLFLRLWIASSVLTSTATISNGLISDGKEIESIITDCKHGRFLLNSQDIVISRHLHLYGEWAEMELQVFLSIVKANDIVLDIGANIGGD